MSTSIFSKIISRDIPADIIFEDERVVAFFDIAPQAPVHVLIVPREEIRSIDDLNPEHEILVGHMVLTAQAIARDLGLDAGYRLVMNCGHDGGQTVWHLHLHLLGGRSMHWPPG
jgi:histidine triad (HIT) family protein